MTMTVSMLAIDLAKDSFQVCAVGANGACSLRHRITNDSYDSRSFQTGSYRKTLASPVHSGHCKRRSKCKMSAEGSNKGQV
jgi:hypothetical protein